MRSILPLLAASLLLTAVPTMATVTGTYVEARTADVYTGPCFANSEVGLTGREAILVWTVDSGTLDGVALDGLSVVAVVRAEASLGDPQGEALASRSLLMVDERAAPDARRALVELARDAAGEILGETLEVRPAVIESSVEGSEARVVAGGLATLATRPLTHQDHVCGNEFVYYPPLAEGVEAGPAATIEHSFTGDVFDATWSSPGKRSAFVGTFRR